MTNLTHIERRIYTEYCKGVTMLVILDSTSTYSGYVCFKTRDTEMSEEATRIGLDLNVRGGVTFSEVTEIDRDRFITYGFKYERSTTDSCNCDADIDVMLVEMHWMIDEVLDARLDAKLAARIALDN